MPRRSTELRKLLKRARVAAGLTLRAVENGTGISNAYLSQLENGKTANPSPRVLSKLAKAYSISYAELMAAAGYLEVQDEPPVTRRLAMLTTDLNFDEQEQVAAFIRHLRSQRRNAS